jgi:hypothetical protein
LGKIYPRNGQPATDSKKPFIFNLRQGKNYALKSDGTPLGYEVGMIMENQGGTMKKTHTQFIAFTIILILVMGITIFAAIRQQSPGQPLDAAKPKINLSEAETAAIKQTALDYIEGYYDGNAERMERALHPELAKRIVRTDPKSGRSRLDQMSALTLVQGTRARAGKALPKEQQQKDVSILDTFEGAASVKIVANDWIDYLHVAKFNGRWVIVNVLWELKPEKR